MITKEIDEDAFKEFEAFLERKKRNKIIDNIKLRRVTRGREPTVSQLLSNLPMATIELIDEQFHPLVETREVAGGIDNGAAWQRGVIPNFGFGEVE